MFFISASKKIKHLQITIYIPLKFYFIQNQRQATTIPNIVNLPYIEKKSFFSLFRIIKYGINEFAFCLKFISVQISLMRSLLWNTILEITIENKVFKKITKKSVIKVSC